MDKRNMNVNILSGSEINYLYSPQPYSKFGGPAKGTQYT
jgi:hypothetical protein